MKENILKKEWSKKDVQRARNLIKGKTGDRTTKGIGYTKKYDYLKQQGFSSKETIEKLMNEFHKSESGIKRALRHIKELIDGF